MSSRKVAAAACLLCGIVWLAVYVWKMDRRFWIGSNDFLQLYAGARLVGTPQLYQAEPAYEIHRQAVGDWLPAVVYTRPPFYAWLLKPLGRLPYLAAYWIFMAVNFAGLCWFCFRYFRASMGMAFLVSCFPPLYIAAVCGNDLGIVLGLLGGVFVLMDRKRDFAAGLLLSLCAIKFHLFTVVPLVLWILGRRRVVAGGATGGAGLLLLSFAAQGLDWPRQYLALLSNPLVHPDVQVMPNLHGIAQSFAPALATPVTLVLSFCAVAAACGLAWLRRDQWHTALGIAVLAGLLVSWHCYFQDCVLLLAVMAMVLQDETSAAVRLPLALLCVPITFWMLMAPAPWCAVPALLMSAALVGALVSAPKAAAAPDALSAPPA